MSATATVFETGHIGLNVSDLARSRRFYEDVFGFETMAESSEGGRSFVFLGYRPKVVLTLWQQSEGAFPPDRPGLHHLSFQVDSVERIRKIERRLRKQGVRPFHDGLVAHGEGQASGGLFFQDPDGIRLEIYASDGLQGAPAPSGQAPTCGFF